MQFQYIYLIGYKVRKGQYFTALGNSILNV